MQSDRGRERERGEEDVRGGERAGNEVMELAEIINISESVYCTKICVTTADQNIVTCYSQNFPKRD